MKYGVSQEGPAGWAGDCLAIGCFEGQLAPREELAGLGAELGGLLASLLGATGFTGQREQTREAYAGPGAPVRRVVIVGLGRPGELDPDRVRRIGAAIARAVKRADSRRLGIWLPPWEERDPDRTVKSLIEGFELAVQEGLWTILGHRFKSEAAQRQDGLWLEEVIVLGAGERRAAAEQAAHACRAIHLARELVAAPSNVIDPEALAQTARELASTFGMELDVADADACRRRGLGAFLSVAGSPSATGRMIHLTYRPAGAPARRVAVVGQGLTFDDAGLGRAIGGGVQAMKYGKGGAAAALGAAWAVGQLRPPVEAHFIIPAAQRSTYERSVSPGDLVTAANGKTIEVNDRGVEGSLLLVDALAVAAGLGVDAIVDLSTLSESCIVALGEQVAALWSTDDALAGEIARAAQQAGEQLWRLPLVEAYRDKLWAPFADLRSSGPIEGRAIATALLLREFAGATPWAHIDMIGPVWSGRVDGYYNAGATGFGAALLLHWLCDY